ncbi:MAG: CBS domain-containing protein [Candidatus Woesearchaeota archaeon]
MTYELGEIKNIRKKLGLTQTQLAKTAQVSQSLIAKIEAGRIDPTYSKTQKIFRTLDDLQKKNELKASEIMQAKVISISPDEGIKDALKKMKKYEISQMPVIEDHKSIGMVTEADLLEALLENKKEPKIGDIMDDSPPVVSEKSRADVITSLLRHYPMILVSGQGKLKGVITKMDYIEKMVK